MDRGIMALWYDLAEVDQHAHLHWLHTTCLPALSALPGYTWVGHYRTIPSRTGDDRVRLNECNDPTVGRGTRYLLLLGAPSVDVFFSRREPLVAPASILLIPPAIPPSASVAASASMRRKLG